MGDNGEMPTSRSPRFEIGLDLGATLVKAIYVRAGRPLAPFESYVCSARNHAALESFLEAHPARRIAATGGGAPRLTESWRGRPAILYVDEFESWGAGERVLLEGAGFTPSSPHLLVSLGTGTSFLAVAANGKVSRVGGTALGGGTIRGLGRLLAGESSHEALVSLARAGDRKKVDLLVGDLYRPGEISLDPSLTASNFGKPGLSRDPRDLVNAAVGLLGENVALMAGAMARGLPRMKGASSRPTVVYAGTTLRHHDVLKEILADVTALAGADARFLPTGEFTGALGALARAREG
jgi:type II pantothenate kinase